MITHAQIHFNQEGTPVADSFDDVYFSNDNGLAESDYVFFQQNHIQTRLKQHEQRHFVIAETGFGTGLNFLNTWQQFAQTENKQVETLHFISFEKYPMTHADLQKALALWPQLNHLSEQLLNQYPMAMSGCHRLIFEYGAVILDLWFGDVKDSLNNMAFSQTGIIDAWYLDGFAPSKNPDMWQQSLFNKMADLGRDNATFATFTAAGFVRRGLIEAGFDVEKCKGFGRKREMIRGVLKHANAAQQLNPFYPRLPGKTSKIAIIGGGIASAALAYSLAKRGIESHIFCKDDALAKGASHNEQGALYPHLQADFNVGSEFYAHSFLFAKRQYQYLLEQGFHFDHDWCGVLLQSISDSKRAIHEKIAEKQNWPKALIHPVTSEDASCIANVTLPYPGLFIPQAGWLNPPQLVHAYINAARQQANVTIHTNSLVEQINAKNEQYQLTLSNDESSADLFSHIVIAAGEHSEQFAQTKDFPLQPVRGQVSSVKATSESEKIKTVLCHKGYFTPERNQLHCVGATFEKDTKARDIRVVDDQTNLSQLQKFYSDSAFSQNLKEVQFSKAAIRCTTPDHHCIVGSIPDQPQFIESFKGLRLGQHYNYTPYSSRHQGIYFLTGFGARGLCTIPLASELLCAELCNEPLPVANYMADKLHPNRFLVRDLKRNQI